MKLTKKHYVIGAIALLTGLAIWQRKNIANLFSKGKATLSKGAELLSKIKTSLSSVNEADYSKKAEVVETIAKEVLSQPELDALKKKANDSCILVCSKQTGAGVSGCMSGCVPDTYSKLIQEELAKK